MSYLPEEVRDHLDLKIQKPGDWTVSDVMKEYGVSDNTARRMMRKLVEEGTVQQFKGILLNGYRGFFFRLTQSPSGDQSVPGRALLKADEEGEA